MAMLRAPGSLALAAAAAFALILIAPGPAHGCKCENLPLSEYADEVDLAFSGRQVERISDEGFIVFVTLVFEVHRVYKGQAGPLIEVRTGWGGGDCGTDFLGKGVTGVAAFGEDGEALGVGRCGSHHSVSDLEEIFGPGYPPDETITLPEETDETTASTDSTAAAPPKTAAAQPASTDETTASNEAASAAYSTTTAPSAATTTTSGAAASPEGTNDRAAAVETAAPPEEQGRGRARYAIPIFIAAVIMAGSTAGLLRRRRQEDGE